MRATQKETGLIAELILGVALMENRNIIFDATLRNVKWYGELLKSIKNTYPNLHVAIVHIAASERK